MFGLIKKLREKDEEINKLHAEKRNILQREAGTIDAYYAAIDRAKKAETKLKYERETWNEKYSALYEKYLNLLERHGKSLEGLHQPQTNLTQPRTL